MTLHRKFYYTGSSKEWSPHWQIIQMRRNAEEITYTELWSNCRSAILEQHLGFGPKNRIDDTDKARFYKSSINGEECYYIEYEDVAYIFMKRFG